jgi:hypothetical protein
MKFYVCVLEKFDHNCLFQSCLTQYLLQTCQYKKLVNMIYQKVQIVQTYMSLNQPNKILIVSLKTFVTITMILISLNIKYCFAMSMEEWVLLLLWVELLENNGSKMEHVIQIWKNPWCIQILSTMIAH